MEEKKSHILNEIKLSQKPEIPTGYLDNISSSVMDKIHTGEPELTSHKSKNFIGSWIAACACILLFIGLQLGNNSIESTPLRSSLVAQSESIENQNDIGDFLAEFDELEFSEIDLDLEDF